MIEAPDDLVNLIIVNADLELLIEEATALGLSKSLRDRLAAAKGVLPVIEAARGLA